MLTVFRKRILNQGQVGLYSLKSVLCDTSKIIAVSVLKGSCLESMEHLGVSFPEDIIH